MCDCGIFMIPGHIHLCNEIVLQTEPTNDPSLSRLFYIGSISGQHLNCPFK